MSDSFPASDSLTVSLAHSLFPAWTHGGWQRTWRAGVARGTIRVGAGHSRRLLAGRGCLLVTTPPQEPSSALDQAGRVHRIKLSRQLLLPQHTEGNLCSGGVWAAHTATHWRRSKASHSEGHLLQGRRKSTPDPGKAHGDGLTSAHI